MALEDFLNGLPSRSRHLFIKLSKIIPPLGTVSIFVIIFTRIDFTEALAVFSRAHFGLVSAAVMFALGLNVFLLADKWRRIFNYLDYKLAYKDALFIKLGSAPLRYIFPMKTGEILIPLYLKKERGVPVSLSLGTIIFDKLYNVLALFIWLSLGLLLWPPAAPYRLLCLAPLLIVVFFLSVRKLKWLDRLFSRLPQRWEEILQNTKEVFTRIPARGRLFLFGYSLIFQTSEVVNLYLLILAVGAKVPFTAILLLVPLNIFLTKLPVTIGGLGLREGFIILFLSQYADPELLFIAGVMLSIIEYFLPHFAGVVLLPKFLRKFSALVPEAASRDAARPVGKDEEPGQAR